MTRHIATMTSPRFGACADSHPSVGLVAVGSVEPHGPHLPLGTDTIISEAAIERAARQLEAEGISALIAPPIPYGVTDFAAGFPGALSIPRPVLETFLKAVVVGLLEQGVDHVCLVNNHLEPAHDQALRSSIESLPEGRASVACPLERRFGRTLTDEFKRGACHAGRYEGSIVLAARPDTVDRAAMQGLETVDISLSDGIKRGASTFRAMGMDDAYAGAPAEATAEEGEATLERLAAMVVTTVQDGLRSLGLVPPA